MLIGGQEAAVMIVVSVAASATVVTWVKAHYRSLQGARPAELARIEERLARIEQALDAVAVETERISEGQRFTSKLLGERAAAPARGEG